MDYRVKNHELEGRGKKVKTAGISPSLPSLNSGNWFSAALLVINPVDVAAATGVSTTTKEEETKSRESEALEGYP